ncbi:MAG: recombination-associated protein RdgC [Methylococcaceae bacterium]|nr:recombination-associated protein RdgC [Methylococcaceae bacterium]
MWFKNLTLFRFTEPFTLSAAEVEEKLQAMPFKPCGPHVEASFGWTSPVGKNADQLIHANNGFMMICSKREEKVLPAAVISEMTQEKITEAEDRDNRKLSKKERTAIKDEVIFELLPRAFAFSRKTYAYIDPKGGWLVVDSASAKKAEDLLSNLRKCLGSLPAVPPLTATKPVITLTQWLFSDELPPADVKIEDECELRAPEEAGGTIRCKRHDLALPEIKNHLDTGKQVIKLAISWEDRISFIIDENLGIKRLKFLELVQDQLTDTAADDEIEQFDVDFSIMTLELANFLPRLLDLFDGELKS